MIGILKRAFKRYKIKKEIDELESWLYWTNRFGEGIDEKERAKMVYRFLDRIRGLRAQLSKKDI